MMQESKVFSQTGVNDMFNKNKKSVRIISSIIIVLLVFTMLVSMLMPLL